MFFKFSKGVKSRGPDVEHPRSSPGIPAGAAQATSAGQADLQGGKFDDLEFIGARTATGRWRFGGKEMQARGSARACRKAAAQAPGWASVQGDTTQ